MARATCPPSALWKRFRRLTHCVRTDNLRRARRSRKGRRDQQDHLRLAAEYLPHRRPARAERPREVAMVLSKARHISAVPVHPLAPNAHTNARVVCLCRHARRRANLNICLLRCRLRCLQVRPAPSVSRRDRDLRSLLLQPSGRRARHGVLRRGVPFCSSDAAHARAVRSARCVPAVSCRQRSRQATWLAFGTDACGRGHLRMTWSSSCGRRPSSSTGTPPRLRSHLVRLRREPPSMPLRAVSACLPAAAHHRPCLIER